MLSFSFTLVGGRTFTAVGPTLNRNPGYHPKTPPRGPSLAVLYDQPPMVPNPALSRRDPQLELHQVGRVLPVPFRAAPRASSCSPGCSHSLGFLDFRAGFQCAPLPSDESPVLIRPASGYRRQQSIPERSRRRPQGLRIRHNAQARQDRQPN
jgi:hypothetical protein